VLEPANSRHEVRSCLVDASCGPFMRRGLQATYRGPRTPVRALRAQIATQCRTSKWIRSELVSASVRPEFRRKTAESYADPLAGPGRAVSGRVAIMNEAEIALHAMVAAFRDAIACKDAPPLAALFALDTDLVNIAAIRESGTRLPRTCHKG